MEPQAILTDAIRKTSEAYREALAAAMKAIADLPREGGQLHRQARWSNGWGWRAPTRTTLWLPSTKASISGSANVGGS